MKHSFTFYADSGHAWLKVSLADTKSVGLSLDSFSEFSYWRNNKYEPFLYLEEDCDAGVFLESYRTMHGNLPAIRESFCDWSKIRNFNRM